MQEENNPEDILSEEALISMEDEIRKIDFEMEKKRKQSIMKIYDYILKEDNSVYYLLKMIKTTKTAIMTIAITI